MFRSHFFDAVMKKRPVKNKTEKRKQYLNKRKFKVYSMSAKPEISCFILFCYTPVGRGEALDRLRGLLLVKLIFKYRVKIVIC